jgi:threonylcarbamoyladenosine tRNA methylthiotransferase MtaB
MKYAVVTFGCRVNQADSLAIESELCARGGEAVPSDRADLVIVNTCSVTASADQGARQTIRRIARENPTARIVATGCYASRCGDEIASLPGVEAVVPNTDKDAQTFVARFIGREPDGPCGRPLAPGLMGRTAWTLRVQTGCEEKCSYCIIPTTRGASRSRTWDEIRAELTRVVAAGYKEIAITGVHLGSYGRDLTPASSLGQLIGLLVEHVGQDFGPAALLQSPAALLRSPAVVLRSPVLLRISSLEPMDFPEEIIDLVGRREARPLQGGGAARPSEGHGGIAPHFHLPLQHASNRILSLMKRPYTIEHYRALVETIRDRAPHVAIGSDIIAGFPGETDNDFEQLTTYLEDSPLTHLHVFPYSDRPGTVASSLPGKVHGSAIKARAQRLREISRVLAENFRAAQRGTVRPALTIEDGSVAVTDNYFRAPAPVGCARNEWVTVQL